MNYEILNLKNFNIIIGKNGAGKTRLLRVFRDDLSSDNIAPESVKFDFYSML